ncbi:MAG: transaldolase [Burkholderiales bacterium]|nr:transaldolase [Burkholderiales bacterium]
MSAISGINALGQRIWLDNLSRKMLAEGELAQHIWNGVTGLTSNPSILLKGFKGSPYYREDLDAARKSGLSPEKRLEALILPDIRGACDLFLPVFENSGHEDGYVSLEVSPRLAFDMEGTVEAAIRLVSEVERPNLMIKVPATPEGIAAFEKLTSLGISINVTLIFSLHQVFHVQEAYVRGLRRYAESGENIGNVRSVASIFLSRIDTLVDNLPGCDAQLKGKAGVTLAKIAYQRYLDRFHGPAQGIGHPQKLLWASTGTKNPAYSDLLYVEPLIGKETVNTLPDATLAAFIDHGKAENTLESGIEEAKAHFVALEKAGINMEKVASQLFEEGMKAFDTAYSDLLALVA